MEANAPEIGPGDVVDLIQSPTPDGSAYFVTRIRIRVILTHEDDPETHQIAACDVLGLHLREGPMPQERIRLVQSYQEPPGSL